MALHFHKIRRVNLPTKIEGTEDYIFLCDDGSIFTNTKTGAMKQLGSGGGGGGGSLPQVAMISGEEPVGFSAIVTTNPAYFMTHTPDGWFGLPLRNMDVVIEYVWEEIPRSATTSGTYTEIEASLQVTTGMHIRSLKFPWGNMPSIVVNGITFKAQSTAPAETIVPIDLTLGPGETMNIKMAFTTTQAASYYSGVYTSEKFISTKCIFGTTDFTSNFSVPMNIEYGIYDPTRA